MTGLLRRVPARTAMGIIIVSVVVLLGCVVWLAVQGKSNDTADERQTTEIAANQNRLDDVSDLARKLKAGLTKANRRLRANGVAPVPVPVASVPGAAGTDGLDGTTGAVGQQGSPGTAGLPGADGLDGAAGATGTNGSTGTTGMTGAQGPKGDTGATGPQGVPGKDGADGAPGTNGVDGAPGQPGAPGADGRPAASFTFTDALGISYTCTDPETDGDYTCRTTP